MRMGLGTSPQLDREMRWFRFQLWTCGSGHRHGEMWGCDSWEIPREELKPSNVGLRLVWGEEVCPSR